MPTSKAAGALWFGTGIHATAVAISGQALVILGPSGSGKSTFALALIAAATPGKPVCLIGDDRILLSEKGGSLIARPHPRIAGFIERRGVGFQVLHYIESAPVAGVVAFGPTTSKPPLLQNFPAFEHVESGEISAAAVLVWWRGAVTTPPRKPRGLGPDGRETLELVTKTRSCIPPAETPTRFIES